MFCFYQAYTGRWFKIPVLLRPKIEEYFEKVQENPYHTSDICWDMFICMHPNNYMFKEIEVLKENNVLSK